MWLANFFRKILCRSHTSSPPRTSISGPALPVSAPSSSPVSVQVSVSSAAPTLYELTDYTLNATPTVEENPQDAVFKGPCLPAIKLKTLHSISQAFFAHLSIVATFGIVNAVGLLQAHLRSHQLQSISSSNVGWVFSTFIALAFLIPGIAGPMYDRYGPRWMMRVGALLHVLGLFAASFFDMDDRPGLVYPMLFVTFGVLCGVGTGLVTTATTGVIHRAFSDRQRGFALGFVFMGASIGGIVWPLLLRCTLGKWGWGWSLRLVSLLVLLMVIPDNVLLCWTEHQPRRAPETLPSNTDAARPPRFGVAKVFNRERFQFKRVLRHTDFVLMTLGLATFEYVTMGVVGTLPTWGLDRNFDAEMMFNVIAVMNIGSACGRVAIGASSDYIGRFNAVICAQFTAIATIFGLLYNVGNSARMLFAFAAVWGFSAGAIMSMMAVVVGQLCEEHEFGKYYGMNSFFISIGGLLCIPTGSQMLDSYGPETHVLFFGGLCGISILILISSRWTHLRRSKKAAFWVKI